MKTRRTAILFTALSLLTAALFIADLAVGSVAVPLGDVWAALTGGACDPSVSDIILKIRLLKAVTALFAGAALAASGLQMQTLFRNPLAGPYVLGVSSGAGLGVAGVALATIGSQAVSMVTAIIYLNRKKFIFTFRLKNFRIDPAKARELAWVGIPISLQECMVRFSFLYLTSVTNRLGIYAASAVGVASKYDVFAMLPATSVANALAAVTAQNYGAGKPERAKKSLAAGLLFAVAASSLFWLWAQLSPQTMIGLFSSDPAIIEAGIPFFRTCSYDYLAVSFVFCMNGYLNGRSQTIFTMISCCFGALALRIPIIHLVYANWPDNLARIGAIAPMVSGFMAVYTAAYLCIQFYREKQRIPGASGQRGMK